MSLIYLPGTIYERIGDLRTNMKLSKRKLAEMIEVEPSQISRIERGETQNISNDILIKLAGVFKVSTDYLLGLTTVSVQKSYEISELGLSEGAVKTLVTKRVDARTLNRLLEHEKFPALIKLIKAYFEDTLVAGIKGRNEVIDMAIMSLADFKKDAQGDITLMKSLKLGDHDAEIEKIKNNFMIIVRDMKKSKASGELSAEPVTADTMQKIWDQLKDKPRDEITAEDVADAMALAVGEADVLGEKGLDLFRQLAGHMLTGGQK